MVRNVYEICGLGVFLGINMIIDLRTKKISLSLSILFFSAGLILRLVQKEGMAALLLSLLPGAFLLLVSFVTAQGIGMGDAVVFFVCGIYLGLHSTVLLLMLSLFLTSIAGMIIFVLKKLSCKTAIPWMPFVFAGFVFLHLFWM